jgi:hypothetical protein
LKNKVYLCSFFHVVTKDGISWTAPRPGRFKPMKVKEIIVLLLFLLKLVNKYGISWTAPRHGRFNPMKLKLLIE